MASLIQELITTLQEECTIYKELIPVGEEKTKVIVTNDLEALERITNIEQTMVNKITSLERKRQEVIVNIATVINKKPEELDLKTMVQLFTKQPKEQKELSQIHDDLKQTIERLMNINHQNQSLIEQSLDLIEFNMNFIQSTRMSPGNNNYNKHASGVDAMAEQTRMFDARQ